MTENELAKALIEMQKSNAEMQRETNKLIDKITFRWLIMVVMVMIISATALFTQSRMAIECTQTYFSEDYLYPETNIEQNQTIEGVK